MSGTFDMRGLEKTGMGKTPDDIKQKCLKLCQDYLAGIWTKQTIDSIEVKRLTGGMLNQLYYCAIENNSEETVNGEVKGEGFDVPKEVAIKFYQKKPFIEEDADKEKERQLNELIIALMASENNLGPKVYGLFEGGAILKYYQQKPFKVEEQKDPELVGEVFEKLARFHAMEVPIRRNTNNLFFEHFDKGLKMAQKYNFIEDMVSADIKVFVENDFNEEYLWTNQILSKIDSPVVFTHNDYRSDNIMILTDNNNNSDNRVVVCDFDFSTYGFRGFDFIHIIKEWGNDNAFFDRHNVYLPPEDSVLKVLFQHYFNESVRIFGKNFAENPKNSVENMIKEYKIFYLIMLFYFILPFGKLLDENHVVPEEMLRFFGGKRPDKQQLMKMSERSYENYWTVKNKLKEQNVF